jgi:hypothetical protein
VHGCLHEAEQQRLLLAQVPAVIATLTGPEHRYSFFNENYRALPRGRAQLARPIAETLPKLASQGFIGTLD